MAHSVEERQRLIEDLAEPLYTGVDLPSFRGVGLGVNGSLHDAAIAPSYVVGVWFTVLFFPVWPVGAYIVSRTGSILGPRRVHARLKLSDIRKIWGVGRLILFILSGPFNLFLNLVLIVGAIALIGSFLR